MTKTAAEIAVELRAQAAKLLEVARLLEGRQPRSFLPRAKVSS